MKTKPVLYIFFILICFSLLTPFVVDKNYLFPFILPRALFLRIVLDIALPFYLYLILAKKEYRPNLKNPLNLSVLVFLGVYFITSFTGVDALRSVWGNIERMGGAWYMMHLVMLYFYVLLLAQASGRLLLRFLKIFLWVANVTVFYGLWVYLGLPGFYADPSLPSRVSSSFGNPIFFASFLVLPLFLSVFFAIQEESRAWKAIYGVMALLQLFGIYQSATRGAFVGLAAGIFLAAVMFLFKAESRRLRNWGVAAVGGIVLVAGALFLFGGKLPSGSFLYRITHLKDSNSEARLIQWKTALQGYKDKPVLGVGPENYYIIANKYYNPELNKYDPSWFDKPHNYLLEILVTTGAVGFAAYLAMLAFFAWSLYKAFKAGLLSWLETCVLLAGMLAYQIQNLFVFDTISASVAFFIYMGFGAYLWHESELEKKPAHKKIMSGLSPAFVNAAAGVSAVAVIYAIYLTSIVPGRVAKNINYGYAYSGIDPVKAEQYFEAARNQPFVFDPGELGVRYADFAANVAQNPPQGLSKEEIGKITDHAIASLEDANARVPNYPIFWYKLAQAYNTKSLLDNGPVDPRADQAAARAVELAPKRPETISYLIQVKAAEGQTDKAVSLSEQLAQLYPWNSDYAWRLAVVYDFAKQDEKAVATAQQALAAGYQIKQTSDIQWLVKYYSDNKNYAAAIALYQAGLKNDPTNVQLLSGLALAYADSGDKQKAIETARQIVVIQPAAKDDVDKFIQGLSQ
ncbi:MAG: O-antigen ligase family protein [Patescibacteria group bacterium]|nr:O-antigen ligase family protein [Patescibacteria group bacterium]